MALKGVSAVLRFTCGPKAALNDCKAAAASVLGEVYWREGLWDEYAPPEAVYSEGGSAGRGKIVVGVDVLHSMDIPCEINVRLWDLSLLSTRAGTVQLMNNVIDASHGQRVS